MKRAAVGPQGSARARFILSLAALLLGLSPLEVANAEEGLTDPFLGQPDAIAAGRDIYRSKCLVCQSKRRRTRTEHFQDKTQRRTIPRNGDQRSQGDADAGLWSSTFYRRGLEGARICQVHGPLLGVRRPPCFNSACYPFGVNFGGRQPCPNQMVSAGMGLNVSATGTYKRVSTASPRFISESRCLAAGLPWWSTCLDFLPNEPCRKHALLEYIGMF